jgi:LPS export ABC transporter protein LptC
MMRRVILVAIAVTAMLSGCRPSAKTKVGRVVTTADSADQIIYGMRTILTDRGVQRAELLADTGFVFDENTRTELRVVTTTFFSKSGARDGVLTAKRGTFNTRANVMEARQNVVIVGVDGKRLTSPHVRFEQYRNMIVSDSAFVLVDGERRLEGVGFESDPQMLNVKVKKLSRGTGASVILPSQKGAPAILRSDAPITAPPATAPSAGVPAASPTPPPVKP